MLALIVVRDGQLPVGADETISECGGRALLIGSGTTAATATLQHVAREISTMEVGDFRPATWAEVLSEHLDEEPIVVLPASPGFYGAPKRIADLVDFVVARILDQLGVVHSIGVRWTSPPE